MQKIFSLVICIVGFWGNGFPQSSPSHTGGQTDIVFFLEKGQKFLNLSEPDSAFVFLPRAELLAEKYLSPEDPVRIRVLLANAAVHLALDHYPEAETRLQQAHTSATKAHIPDLEAESLISLGYAACATNRYPAAEGHLAKAESLLIAQTKPQPLLFAKLRFGQGYLLQLQQDYPLSLKKYAESRTLFEQALSPDDPEVARALNFAGQVYRAMGENENALKNHLQALAIQQKKLPEEHLEIARTYLYLGICAYQEGDYPAALDYYEQALRIRRRKLGEKHRLVASVYNNLGLVFWMEGQPRQALSYYTSAVSIYIELLGPEDIGVATGYNNMGLCYTDLKQFKEAIHYYSLALGIRIKRQGKDHPSLAGIYNNIGLAQLDAANYTQAMAGFREALRIGEQNEGFHQVRVGKYYSNIGRVYREMKDPIQALQWHQQALIHAITDYSDTNWCHNPPVESFPISPDFLEILHHKARSINDLPQNQANATCALETYLAAASLIDLMRVRYLSEDAKFRLARRASEIYADGITTARQLYLLSGKNPQYMDIALRFSEKQKAMVLLEALNTARAEKFGMLPEALIIREKQLRKTQTELKELLFEEKQKGGKSDSLVIAEMTAKLFTAGRQYDSLTRIFDTQYPRYYQLKYQSEPPGISDILGQLPPETGIVEYYLGSGNLHIFLITASRTEWMVVSDINNLSSMVKRFQESIFGGFRNIGVNDSLHLQWADQYVNLADSLYQRVFAPLTDAPLPEKLFLIPDGMLGYIPFDALLTSKPENAGAYRNYPYLIRRFTLSQHYSAALLFRSDNDPSDTKPLKHAVIFAPVFTEEMEMPGQKKPQPLIYSEEEAQKITRLTGGDIFLKRAASKSAFFEQAGKYQIIHISSHARVNDRDPMFSTIDFAEGETVNVLDLFGMEIQADLVTLSACETGSGELFSGEGIMSLARGFIYAGAKSIVNTLWEVNDAATAEIMTSFYESLSAGNSKDEALRNAKTGWLSRADHLMAHPYYWAGYIAVGDMSALPVSHLPVTLFLIAGVIVAIILTFFLIYRRK
ncbi:MAG: CHAT domain-containing tetratricopeptide repeat protein [Bacteroidia bacterium]